MITKQINNLSNNRVFQCAGLKLITEIY